MQNLFLVGLGGCLGAIARFLMVNAVGRFVGLNQNFPFGTLAVNVIGCLLIGFLSGYTIDRSFLTYEMRLLLIVGVLGGFTTYSAFGYETFYLLKSGQPGLAFLNIFLQTVLGLAAVAVGYVLSKPL